MKNKVVTYLQLHFLELKYNFFIYLFLYIYLFLTCYYFSDQLIFLFIKILMKSNTLKYFIFTNITEIFLTNFLISFFISFYLSVYFLLLQLWFFISKGLYKFENLIFLKTYIYFILFNIFIISIILIQIIPNLWFFFIKINFSNTYLFNIFFEPKLNNYFYFLFISFFYIYLIFLYFFIVYKIFRMKIIISLRKFFYIKFLILSIFVSPPDFLSQFFFFYIFLIFFELLIFIYIFLYKYFNNF